MIRAPQGLDLKAAIDRLATVDLGQEPSLTLGGHHAMPGAEQQLQTVGSRVSAHASTPSSPALAAVPTLSPSLRSRLPLSPAGRPARPPSTMGGSLAPSEASQSGNSIAIAAASCQHQIGGADQQQEKEKEEASVAQQTSSSKENHAQAEDAACAAVVPPVAGAQLEAAGQPAASGGLGQLGASVEPPEAPSVDLAIGGITQNASAHAECLGGGGLLSLAVLAS